MPFTIEQIEAAFAIKTDDWYSNRSLAERKKNKNYDAVIGYLTGTHNSLQGLQHDYENYLWIPLLRLLNSVENPSPNDQLIIDLAMNPFMEAYVQGPFALGLTQYVYNHPGEKVLQAALQLFHTMKYTQADIIEKFLFNEDSLRIPADFLHTPSPVKDFLLNELKNSSGLIQRKQLYHRWEWFPIYFYLLEEVRPELAKEYAIQVSVFSNTDVVKFFVSYKDGHYMSAVTTFLLTHNHQALADKLSTSVKLYELNQAAYTSLIIATAQQYLDYLLVSDHRDRWEQGTHLAEFEKNPPTYLPYSVIAFHFLLQLDKEKGLFWLQEFQKQKTKFDKTLVRIVHLHLQQEALPFLQQALPQEGKIDFLQAVVNTLVKHFDATTFLPILWNAATSKSLPLKESIASILVDKDGEAEAKAIALLNHKKTEVRQMAVMVLSYFFDYPAAREAMTKALNSEVNEIARDRMLDCVVWGFPAEPDLAYIQNTIDAARERGKLSKPVEDFLDEDKMPALYYKNGEAVTTEAIRFLLYRMKRVKTMRSEPEAKLVISQLDKQKSSDFALYIIKRFIETGGKPEHKYLLALAGLIGDDAVAEKIRTTLNGWIEGNRIKMAEHAVGALALIGTNKTLRWVEWYSRKYRNKKGIVGTAALAALEAAAIELNITIFELGDRIVPDFGFEGLFKNFEVDGETYRAFIDSNFKIAFFNDDNKKLKAIPSAANTALKEEFKDIAKEVRDVVKSQSSRLEYYLAIQRRWTVEQWQHFFLSNPIMFIYATKLLWGVYENNQLTQCFYCQEDTTLVDANDNEVTLPENAQIGIVHPLHLSKEALQTWSQQFFDLAIEPVFPQLNRPVYSMPEADKQLTIIRTFDGVQTAVGAIKTTLEKYGWTKGPAEDAGSINLFYKEDGGKVKAVLEVEGVFVAGFDSDMDPKLGRLYFLYNSGKRRFNAPNDDSDPRLYPLEKVPEVFYSEVIADISAIKLHEAK